MLRVSFAVIVAYVLLLPALWAFLLGVWPLGLLQVSQGVSRLERKLKPLLRVGVPVRQLLLLGLFQFRPRALDAWVRHQLPAARENFARLQTVARRKTYVAMPAFVNEQRCETLSARFRQLAGEKRAAMLITGEGGAGKTSLACQMAMWAMTGEGAEGRLAGPRVLPVLIEGPLEPRADHNDGLWEAIGEGLRKLIGEAKPVSEDLVRRLLDERRVLVIADGFSEWDDAARQSLRPARPERLEREDFPAAALIVTSRIEETLGGVAKTVIRLPRLEGIRLSEFLDRCLNQLDKRGLFNDAEFFTACAKLSEAAGDREITALIARMYAEQMIAAKEAGADDPNARRELPCSLPDLMLGHIKTLNDQVPAGKQELRSVIGAARITAWECLKQTCRPAAAKRGEVIEALGKEENAEALLEYLEKRLGVLQGAGPDRIRFSLDPLAEYLAALHLVERYGKREDLWLKFIEQAREEQNAREMAGGVKDFLLAVRDCCLEKGDEHRMSEWIKDELVRLSGLDPAVFLTAQTRQRINHWIATLKSTHAEDRRVAAQTLGQMGLKAKEAAPALIIALKEREATVRNAVVSALAQIGPPAVPSLIIALRDRDAEVCRSAAAALAQIGSPAAPALITALTNEDAVVRRSAASVLGQIGPAAKEAVSELIAALTDQIAEVRCSAASALGRIGPEAEEAVPLLIAALADEDAAVRYAAADALGKIGPGAKEAVPVLITALTDRDAALRRSAAFALGQIGSPAVPALMTALQREEPVVRSSAAFALGQVEPKAKEAVPVLITALNDQNAEVWRPAASALGQIGPEAKDAVPALVAALKDQDEAVRRPAAEALGKIGPAAVPSLITALKDQDAAVRSSAVYALWQIGPEAKDAVPALIAALKDQDAEVRSSVAAALRRIGPATT